MTMRKIGAIPVDPLYAKGQEARSNAGWLVVTGIILGAVWHLSGSDCLKYVALLATFLAIIFGLVSLELTKDINDYLEKELEKVGVSDIIRIDRGVFFARYNGEYVKVNLFTDNCTSVSVWISPVSQPI